MQHVHIPLVDGWHETTNLVLAYVFSIICYEELHRKGQCCTEPEIGECIRSPHLIHLQSLSAQSLNKKCAYSHRNSAPRLLQLCLQKHFIAEGSGSKYDIKWCLLRGSFHFDEFQHANLRLRSWCFKLITRDNWFTECSTCISAFSTAVRTGRVR